MAAYARTPPGRTSPIATSFWKAYRLLPGPAAVAVAAVLPAFELALGAALLFAPTLRRVTRAAGAVLSAAFLVVHSSAYARRLGIGCGCLADAELRLGWRSLAGRRARLSLA